MAPIKRDPAWRAVSCVCRGGREAGNVCDVAGGRRHRKSQGRRGRWGSVAAQPNRGTRQRLFRDHDLNQGAGENPPRTMRRHAAPRLHKARPHKARAHKAKPRFAVLPEKTSSSSGESSQGSQQAARFSGAGCALPSGCAKSWWKRFWWREGSAACPPAYGAQKGHRDAPEAGNGFCITSGKKLRAPAQMRPVDRHFFSDFNYLSGGHDRDRTCDPYHVKVVLSR